MTTTTTTTPLCSTSFDHIDIRRSQDYELVNRLCRSEWGTELETLNFHYELKSNRLWHPLQNVRSEFRTHILADAGLRHQYDIQCCAPTLIYQYAQRLGLDVEFTHVPHYLKNRNLIRTALADETGLDVRTVKVVINALFSGARLGLGVNFAVSHLVNHDPVVIQTLKNNQYLQQLKSEIRQIWSHIKPHQGTRTITDRLGRVRTLPMSSRQKWAVYFQLEYQVMQSVQTYLRESGARCFLEHDGWCCESDIDRQELQRHVYAETGYWIEVVMTTTTTTTPLCSTSFDDAI